MNELMSKQKACLVFTSVKCALSALPSRLILSPTPSGHQAFVDASPYSTQTSLTLTDCEELS